jgi:hypothetical protein
MEIPRGAACELSRANVRLRAFLPVEEFCFALVLSMSVVEQVFGNLLVVESDVPDIWDFRHLASRQPPNVGTGEAYNASKWLCEFNCVMLTIAPGMNAVPTAPSGNNLALCSSECDELHDAELGNWRFRHVFSL